MLAQALQAQIDRMVYALYAPQYCGVTEEEVAVVTVRR